MDGEAELDEADAGLGDRPAEDTEGVADGGGGG